MKRAFRVAGYGAGALLVLVLLLATGVYGFSARDLNAIYAVEVQPLVVPTSPADDELVGRGEHVAVTRGCMDCHAIDGGGKQFADDPAFGVLWASNLTAGEGGIGGSYTDADWDRSVRHGVAPSGRPLIFMPSHEYWPLSDADMAALIAYFRSLPAVDRVRPESRPGPLARLLHVTGQLNLVPAKVVDHGAERPAAPAVAPTAEYGAYLATGCAGCHNPSFSGGKIVGGDPSWPEAANLTPHESGIGEWSRHDFTRAMRDGIRPDGSAIDRVMPVAFTKHMTDVELEALYAYFTSLEPRPRGER